MQVGMRGATTSAWYDPNSLCGGVGQRGGCRPDSHVATVVKEPPQSTHTTSYGRYHVSCLLHQSNLDGREATGSANCIREAHESETISESVDGLQT